MQLAAYDFEDNKVDRLHLVGAGTSITETVSAAGGHSLELKECDSNDRQWMPLASIPLSVQEHREVTGYQISFDAMLDKETPGTLSLSIRGKNSSTKQKNLATVVVAKDGIRVNRCLLAPIVPGSWQHFDFHWTPTQASDRTVQVTITTEQGDTWQQPVPLEDYFFKQATELQFISTGGPKTKAYIDNVVVTSNTKRT